MAEGVRKKVEGVPEVPVSRKDIEELLKGGKDAWRTPKGELVGRVPKEKFREVLDKLPDKEIIDLWKKFSKEKVDELPKEGKERREFLKKLGILIALASGGGVVYELFGEKGQEAEKPEEITAKKEKEIGELSDIEAIEELAKYARTIERAKKQTPDEFGEELLGKDFSCLIFGDRDLGLGYKEAAKIVEKLIQGGKMPSVFVVEGNSKESINPAKWPLADLVEKNHIKIAPIRMGRDRDRKITTGFPEITESVKAITKANKKDGIVVISVRQELATTDGRKNDKSLTKLNRGKIPLYGEKIPDLPSEKEASESNSTIKESLEKEGIISVVVQLEDWHLVTDSFNFGVERAYSEAARKGEGKEAILNSGKKAWKDFILTEKKAPFVVQYPGAGERTRALVLPFDVPKELPYAVERAEYERAKRK